MNKLRILTVASLFVMASSLLALPSAYATNTTRVIVPGADCQAANLTQAMKGIGWSQAGIKNNAPIPLFVVCPLTWVSGPYFPVAVGVLASFPGSTGTVACTARAQGIGSGVYASTALTLTAGEGRVGSNRSLLYVAVPSFLATANNTIVCALDPGEGIEFVISL